MSSICDYAALALGGRARNVKWPMTLLCDWGVGLMLLMVAILTCWLTGQNTGTQRLALASPNKTSKPSTGNYRCPSMNRFKLSEGSAFYSQGGGIICMLSHLESRLEHYIILLSIILSRFFNQPFLGFVGQVITGESVYVACAPVGISRSITDCRSKLLRYYNWATLVR